MALHKPAQQSGTYDNYLDSAQLFEASNAVDGSKSGRIEDRGHWSCAITPLSSTEYHWWSVDLEGNFLVTSVALSAREDINNQLGMFMVYTIYIS